VARLNFVKTSLFLHTSNLKQAMSCAKFSLYVGLLVKVIKMISASCNVCSFVESHILSSSLLWLISCVLCCLYPFNIGSKGFKKYCVKVMQIDITFILSFVNISIFQHCESNLF
jgi:hypothetical protein